MALDENYIKDVEKRFKKIKSEMFKFNDHSYVKEVLDALEKQNIRKSQS